MRMEICLQICQEEHTILKERREKHQLWLSLGLAVVLISTCQAASAQTNKGVQLRTFTLEEAVDFALKNYPAVRVSVERVSGAQAGVDVARAEYLSRLDTLWQGNRATRNNTFGLLLPQNILPSISGPVLPTTSNQGVWGSAAGLLFSWEPFDFGRRGAEVNAARAARRRATAEVAVTRLDVAVATVNAYLTLLAAEQTVRVAEADVNRRQVFAQAVNVLVANQLRAGAEASRANAELARAKANLARAQQQQEVSMAALADILGIADARIEIREWSACRSTAGWGSSQLRYLITLWRKRSDCASSNSTPAPKFLIAPTIRSSTSNPPCTGEAPAPTRTEVSQVEQVAWTFNAPTGLSG